MIIADTNVVSELMRDAPDEAVLAWASALAVDEVGICVITVEEIERGIARLPAGRRRQALALRWAEIVRAYGDLVVPYDATAARYAAEVLVAAERSGIVMGHADAQIAGICLAAAHELATRNVKDFAAAKGLTVTNPFGAA